MEGVPKTTVAHVGGGLCSGGTEMVVYRYISHMDPELYNWIYIVYNPPEERVRRMFEEKGFKIYQVTRKKENFLKSCWEVLKILRENHVQIVHAHMTIMSFVPNMMGMLVGVKTRIAHSHSVVRSKGIKIPIYWLCKKLSTWFATARFACTEEAARYLFGEKGAQSAVIMHNALDYEIFRFDAAVREEMRSVHGLEGYVVLGHVGRFVEVKNHEFLLRVFAEYRKQNENSRLVLIGDGPLLERTKTYANELGLAQSVMFVPPTSEVNRWYMAMDVFVFPSLYEGLGLAAVEAQIAGLPVVMSSHLTAESALSDNVQRVSLEESASEWSKRIGEAVAGGRTGDVHEELTRRHLNIEQEAVKLDHFYRKGVWG